MVQWVKALYINFWRATNSVSNRYFARLWTQTFLQLSLIELEAADSD